jgi:preprotein translocase subunit SecG
MLFGLLVVVFVIVCIMLTLVILVQSDKGGGLSSAFGGGLSSASALLGTQDTANILTKGTWYLAGVFGFLCIILSLVVGRMEARGNTKSVLKDRAERNATPASVLQGGGLKLEDDGAGGTGGGGTGSLPIQPSGEGAAQQPAGGQ